MARWSWVTWLPLCAGILCGCATIYSAPINRELTSEQAATVAASDVNPDAGDDRLIMLAFSGGGMRASAFSYGVLVGLSRTQGGPAGKYPLLNDIQYVSGVSGGAVTAAYFGLTGRAAFSSFPQRFLLRDAEESLDTQFTLPGVIRAYQGGSNDSQRFADWLDRNVFQGATFKQLKGPSHPHVFINAADVYDRTPFVFDETSFRAICSDLDAYPIANAVAASAAMPLVFTPMVLASFGDRCSNPLPKWVTEAQNSKTAPPLLKASAQAIARYRNGSVSFIKLLDGGIVDFYGLAGFTIARLSSDTPYQPLTAQQAIKLRRILVLVVDAGRSPSGNWARSLEGPNAPELIMAAADTSTASSAYLGFTAFESTMSEWRETLVRWRCGLSRNGKLTYRLPAKWDCSDLKVFVGHLDFDQFSREQSLALNAIPTRFKLEQTEVNSLVLAGQEALQTNPTFRSFLLSLSEQSHAPASAALSQK